MGYRRSFLAVLGAAAMLMVFVGTASAGSTITSSEGLTPSFSATSANVDMDLWTFVTVECGHSEIKGQIEKHGVEGNAWGRLSSWTFTGCNYTIHVQNNGSWEFTSANNVISSGAKISVATSVGECVYTTNGTSIGTLTEGAKATLDINSSKVPRTAGNFLCGSSSTWTGSYSFTTPGELYVD